jgi:hypothetical protein
MNQEIAERYIRRNVSLSDAASEAGYDRKTLERHAPGVKQPSLAKLTKWVDQHWLAVSFEKMSAMIRCRPYELCVFWQNGKITMARADTVTVDPSLVIGYYDDEATRKDLMADLLVDIYDRTGGSPI